MANNRDCESCKHHKEVCKDGIFYHSCESWDCEFEPCEPVRNPDQLDCISRQAVLDILKDKWNMFSDANDAMQESINIIESLQPVSSSEKPKSEWQHDHEILKAYSDGANDVLDKIKAEIEAMPKTYPFVNHLNTYVKDDDVRKILDKYKAEGSEE